MALIEFSESHAVLHVRDIKKIKKKLLQDKILMI